MNIIYILGLTAFIIFILLAVIEVWIRKVSSFDDLSAFGKILSYLFVGCIVGIVAVYFASMFR